MGYTLPQIAVILAKADRTMYKIGAIAYDDMFNQLDESLDYDRDIIYIYKVAVEYADNFYVGTDKLDAVVERLGAKVAVYDFGQLTPIYSDSTIVTQVVPLGAALDDLSDVTITNVQNNQTLRYSSSLGQWVNVGPGASVRNRQQFTATLNQTVFVTSFQFESGLLDVYLNGVKLSPPSYTTFGNYTITLADGSLADDIVEVIAYAPETSFIDLSGYVPTSRTLTINGVTYDLSANRSWTVTAGLSSVGLSMPSGFTVSNSPLTANGTISVIGAGTTAQYIRGDGSLATFPALTGYIPYTGATTNVNLGEFALSAGQFTLDTSPTGTAAVGTTRWNDALGSSETTLKGGSVILKNGVDLVARIVNKVTPNATLTKAAYQVVRVSGAQGQRLAVAYAQANNDNNSADTLGLVIETIPTNQEGFIITMGQIENINTTGSLQGETWVDGDVLYLSPFTPGAITKVKPTGNGHIVVVGYVEYAHANNGKIYVKVMNGWELDELHDVDIVSPANNEALIYESSTSLWKNKTIATALGYTPISGSGVAGQVAYWNGTNSQTGSNNLFWDAANARLGIGTATPSGRVHIVSTTVNDALLVITPNNNSALYPLFIGGATLTSENYLRANNSNIEFFRNGVAATIRTVGSSNNLVLQSSSDLLLNTNGANERVRIFTTTGNISLNSSTDAGYRLDVNGTARVSGASTFARITATTSGIELDYNSGILYHAGGSGSYYQYIDGVSYTFRSRTATGSLIFATQDIERMRLTSGGNLLVGTTTDNGNRFQVSGAGSFTNIITLNTSAADTVSLIVNGNTGSGVRQRFINQASSGFYNWQIGTSISAVNQFEILPSTAIDGTTFTTPVFKISTAGAATFSSSVTATSFIKSGGTSSQYLMADGSVTTGGGGGSSVDELQVALLSQVYG